MAPRPSARLLARVCQQRSVILGYHGVADTRRLDDPCMLQIAPRRFRAQVQALTEAGFRFVTLAEFARLSNGATPPPGLAVITFDDGLRNNHSTALPILQEFGVPATVFVTIDFINASSPWIGTGGDGAMMSEDELRELVVAGWELGAHTITHADLSTLDYAACLHEIEGGRTALQDIAGVPVETFAYPFGRYGPTALAAVRDSALIAAVTTGSGSWQAYELTRAMIGAADPMPVVLLKLTDRYEPLLRSRPTRALREGSKRFRSWLIARSSTPS